MEKGYKDAGYLKRNLDLAPLRDDAEFRKLLELMPAAARTK
jgi:hypothetical protein